MNPEITIALIEAGGAILSSIIGVAGVFLIVKNRQDIIKLAKEVEAYHKHEGNLVKKILELENKVPTSSMIQNRRGSLKKGVRHSFACGRMGVRHYFAILKLFLLFPFIYFSPFLLQPVTLPKIPKFLLSLTST